MFFTSSGIKRKNTHFNHAATYDCWFLLHFCQSKTIKDPLLIAVNWNFYRRMKRFPRFQQAEPVPESSSVDLQETSTFIDKNHKEHPNPLTHSIHSSWVIFWFDAHRMADEPLSILLPSQFGISVQNCRFTLHLWPFPGVPISSSSTLGKHGLRFAQLQETLQQGWSKPGGHSTICQRFFSCK